MGAPIAQKKRKQPTTELLCSSHIKHIAHLLVTEHNIYLQETTVQDLIETYGIPDGLPYAETAALIEAYWQKRERLKRASRASLEANRLKRECDNQRTDRGRLSSTAAALSSAEPLMRNALTRVVESGESFADALDVEVEEPAERVRLFEYASDWYREWLLLVMRPSLRGRARQIWKINQQVDRELKRLRRRAGLSDGIPYRRLRLVYMRSNRN